MGIGAVHILALSTLAGKVHANLLGEVIGENVKVLAVGLVVEHTHVSDTLFGDIAGDSMAGLLLVLACCNLGLVRGVGVSIVTCVFDTGGEYFWMPRGDKHSCC